MDFEFFCHLTTNINHITATKGFGLLLTSYWCCELYLVRKNSLIRLVPFSWKFLIVVTIFSHFGPFGSILVHFDAPHGKPHYSSPTNLITHMYPAPQELLNATIPTFLAQLVQKILIQHGPLPWVKVERSYYHLPCSKKLFFLKNHFRSYFNEAGS